MATGLTNAGSAQTIPTYDASGQAIHPDVLHFGSAWNGYTYWMAMTPYTGGNDQTENPSIVASDDGIAWEVPPGLTNPIHASPAGAGYNADPDLVYNDDTDELWCYFLEYDSVADDKVRMRLRTSDDGVTWSAAVTCITWDISDLGDNERSWGIVKVGSNWHYWAQTSIAPHDVVYRTSSDGLTWSSATNVTFSPVPPKFPWHLDVIHVGAQFWMMYTDDSGATGKLRFATSSDGLAFTLYTGTVMSPSASGWDSAGLYRPSMVYDAGNDLLRVWYSARNGTPVWGTGYTERDYSDFLGSINVTILALQPDATAGIDTNLDSSNPTFNYGISTVLTVGSLNPAASNIFRNLLKFAGLSDIPVGAVVSLAILTLVCTSESNTTDRTIGVHRSLVQWFEGVKLGAVPDASQDGSTYNLRNANGAAAWGAAGGLSGTDYTALATASTVITAPGTFTWDVTADVAAFVANPAINHGWWLINTGQASNDSRKLFASSDNVTAGNRPLLTVTYTLPGVPKHAQHYQRMMAA